LLPAETVRGGILAGTLIGALLLFVAEFTPLYQVHTAASALPVRTVGTGSHESYALVLLAVLAAALGYGIFRTGSRPALLAVGLVGLVALLIALLGDLPDAQATGLLRSPDAHFVNASSTPSAGLYLETLGAIVLIATCVLGFLGLGKPDAHPPNGRPRSSSGGSRSSRTPRSVS
jgi:hypothetical protein